MPSWLLFLLYLFLIGPVFYSFFEWVMHKYLMHNSRLKRFKDRRAPLRWLATPVLNHLYEHHAEFDFPNDFEQVSLLSYMLGKTSSMPLVLLIWTPTCLGLGWLVGWVHGFGMLVSAIMYVVSFEALHWEMHKKRDRWYRHNWLYRFLAAYHERHHKENGECLNVVLPIADLILGTYPKDLAY